MKINCGNLLFIALGVRQWYNVSRVVPGNQIIISSENVFKFGK